MFAQVIKGRAKDEAGLRKQFERWVEEVRPGAIGFLGATTGISKDGTWFTIARFESEDAARQSSDRPEQSEWWSETEQYLSDVTFNDCSEVDQMFDGGSNNAGFVQVMEGRATDIERLRSLGREMEPELKKMRPDIIGGVIAWHGDGGGYTQVMYFESEARARQEESNMSNEGPPPEFAQLMGPISYVDLSDPWFV